MTARGATARTTFAVARSGSPTLADGEAVGEDGAPLVWAIWRKAEGSGNRDGAARDRFWIAVGGRGFGFAPSLFG